MTVGELRKELEGVPDDAVVAVYADTSTLIAGSATEATECDQTETDEFTIMI